MPTDRVAVGAFAGAFGVKGDVRLKSFCADPASIAEYVPLYTEDGRRFDQIVLIGQGNNALIARVGGVTTKESADALKGQRLYAERANMPALPDDEYYYSDLIGLEVVDTGGNRLGRVKAVLNHGAGDILEVQGKPGGETILLPFTLAAVPTVDVGAGRIVADPPEGVLPGSGDEH